MDRQTDEWMDSQRHDRRMNGWTDRETRHTDKRVNQKQTLTSGWMKLSYGNRKTDGQTDRQVDRQKMYEEQTNRQMKELNISLEWI